MRINLPNGVGGTVDSQARSLANKSISDLETKGVSVKWFGAVGDGNTDDTQAINDAIAYASTNLIPVFLPAGQYLVSSTISIDVMKTKLYGHGGSTALVIKPTTVGFTGNKVLLIYCSSLLNSERNKRMRTIGGFNIRNLETNNVVAGLSAIQTNGDQGTSQFGMMDSLKVEEIYISYFDTAIMHEDKTYKYIFERIYVSFCNYSLNIPRSLTDSGEGSTFSACWFVDGSGKMRINRVVTFENCSIHPRPSETVPAIVLEYPDSFVTFNNCHFEHLSSETAASPYKEPWFDIIFPTANVNFNSCEILISVAARSNFKECVFRNRGSIKFDNCNMRYFIPNVYFDVNTLKAAGEIGTIVKNLEGGQSSHHVSGWYTASNSDVYQPITNKPIIRDYLFKTMTTADANKIFCVKSTSNTQTYTDRFTDANVVTAISIQQNYANSQYGTNALRLDVTNNDNANDKFMMLGSCLTIPTGKLLVGLRSIVQKVGGVNIREQNDMYSFYDEFGILIPHADVQELNNGVNLFRNTPLTADNTWSDLATYRTYRKIPPGARYVFVSHGVCQTAKSSSASYYFDYFAPSFL